MKNKVIALLTDFGTEDGYVGAMKGRILTEAPSANIIDISHQIPPFDVSSAAFCLNNCYQFFPKKTVFIAVVDPGVGTNRKGIVVKTNQYYFVGPDNGIFSFIYKREGYQVFEILLEALNEDIAPTFHGRDVFARIGSWIVCGKDLKNYIRITKKIYSLLRPFKKLNDREFILQVFHIDHFGNMILNFHKDDLIGYNGTPLVKVKIDDMEFNGIASAFGDATKGELLLTWDSSGFLQIAQNMGNASDKLNASIGSKLRLWLG